MPDVSPPQRWTNPGFPAAWQGGVFEGVLAPLHDDWYAEARALPERVAEMGDWAPFEPLTEGDPPDPWGFDLSSVGAGTGAGGGPRQTETLTGVVKRVSATRTGLVLEELPDEWLNVSRFSAGVDLGPYGAGDLVEVEVETGANGKRYLQAIRPLGGEGGA